MTSFDSLGYGRAIAQTELRGHRFQPSEFICSREEEFHGPRYERNSSKARNERSSRGGGIKCTMLLIGTLLNHNYSNDNRRNIP